MEHQDNGSDARRILKILMVRGLKTVKVKCADLASLEMLLFTTLQDLGTSCMIHKKIILS